MAKIKKNKPSKASDLWDYKPRGMEPEQAQRLRETAEFFNVPVEDYLYYIIADLILSELKARGFLKPWARRSKMTTAIMEKIALLDYGKELIKNESEVKR